MEVKTWAEYKRARGSILKKSVFILVSNPKDGGQASFVDLSLSIAQLLEG